MNATAASPDTARYARCIDVSKRVRWDIDRDVIRGRRFDFTQRFLPEGLALTASLGFLSERERRLLGQVQGRTYANMFGTIERYIVAKMMECGHGHALGDQVALEALVRMSDEELKHQALFERIDALCAEGMPPGYHFVPQPDDVAKFVLGKSTWAVLALTLHVELFTQVHYRSSIADDALASPLYRDVFFFHWKEESQHAILDELEWRREDRELDEAGRDAAVGELIELVAGIDGLLVAQAAEDARYFVACCERAFDAGERARIGEAIVAAYRWQYIVSGAQDARFADALASLTTPLQRERIAAALAPLVDAVAPFLPSAAASPAGARAPKPTSGAAGAAPVPASTLAGSIALLALVAVMMLPSPHVPEASAPLALPAASGTPMPSDTVPDAGGATGAERAEPLATF